MKELHNITWYSKQISPKLPDKAFRPTPLKLLGGMVYIIVAAVGIMAILKLNLNLGLKLLLSAVIGWSFGSLGLLSHEILHGNVVKNSLAKEVLGAVGFWSLNVGPRLWVKWHNTIHHSYTQDEKKDPDAWITSEEVEKSKFLTKIYNLPMWFRSIVGFLSLTFTFTMHSMRMFKRYRNSFKGRKKVIVWMELILPLATWIILLFYVGFKNWTLVYLIPALIGNLIVMAYISTNHRLNPLVDINDPLANSLTVTVPKWVDVMHFNFSYHTEHHLFPGMSSKYYPLVKKQIKEMWPDRYHEMNLLKALSALYFTPRVYHNKTELLEPRKKGLYGSLGNGLNPHKINYRKIDNLKIK